ncbi:MAG: hypothetical protein GX348_03690 [Veillonellaceae bacterium]|nr:hypothetical protein [Veillonellaceae bacterium]
MSSKLCRADVPFREALRYINVNSFGSNLCVLVARNYVEVDIYGRNLPLPGVKSSKGPKRSKGETFLHDYEEDVIFSGSEESADLRKDWSVGKEKQQRYRTRANVRQIRLLINQNFDPHTAQLISLTFRHTNAIGFLEAEEHFKRFLKELQRKYNGMKFVAVIEPHERGGYHLHAVVNQRLAETVFEVKPLIEAGVVKSKKAALTYMWPHGILHQKPLSGGGNLGACLAGYLSKKAACPDMKYKQYYRKSKNLEPFQKLRGEDAMELIQQHGLGAELEEIFSYHCTGLDYIESKRHYEFCLNPEQALLYGPPASQPEKLQNPAA